MQFGTTFAATILSLLLASQVFSANVVSLIDIDQLVDETIAESDEPMVQQFPSAHDYLMLDFEALVYDLFLSLVNQENFDERKIRVIEQEFRARYPEAFDYLYEERFDHFVGLAWHPMANVSIPVLRASVLSNIIPMQERARIADELHKVSDDECFNYALTVFNAYATKATLKNIIDLWVSTKAAHMGKHHVGDSGCSLQ